MDDFTFQPPEFEGGSESHMPMNAEAAWILQLINIKLNKADVSDELRKEFIEDITPYIVNASMTQVSRGEIDLFLNIFEELWMEFKVFKYRKRNNPQLNYVHTLVAGYLMQNYNKSIEGWQGNHVFEQKHTYDVRQTNKSVPHSQGGLFRNKKSKKEVMDESEAIQR